MIRRSLLPYALVSVIALTVGLAFGWVVETTFPERVAAYLQRKIAVELLAAPPTIQVEGAVSKARPFVVQADGCRVLDADVLPDSDFTSRLELECPSWTRLLISSQAGLEP